MSHTALVAILACGNPSRGDDGLAPLLLDRLQAWIAGQAGAERFELINDFQWQIENALDLAGRQLVLFIDAGYRTPAPFVFRRLCASATRQPVTHALSPEAVLAVLARISDQPPPPAFVLCVAGDNFDLGEAIGATARRHAESAFAALQDCCRQPTATHWQERADEYARGGLATTTQTSRRRRDPCGKPGTTQGDWSRLQLHRVGER